MRFITDYGEARHIDQSAKNKWRREWLQDKDGLHREFSLLWLRKIDEAGEAWCNLCSKRVVYGSNGKKVLLFATHASNPQHIQRLDAQLRTTTLPTDEPVIASLPKTDRIIDLHISCRTLPSFSFPPALADLCKTRAEVPKVLHHGSGFDFLFVCLPFFHLFF